MENTEETYTISQEDVQELVSTRRISEVKTIIGKIKDKIVEKDTIEKNK